MSDCCSTSHWQRAQCPQCHNECREVASATMLQHLESPWLHTLATEPHFFCANRDCEVIYFALNGNRYTIGDLRPETREAMARDMICYCYGINKTVAQNDPAAKTFVINQTRNKACACESRNPSGRCCLKDFPS